MSDVSIARCTPPQWKRFRDIRLRALADAPEAFWHSYEQESSRHENDWRKRLSDPARAVLFAVRGGGDVGVATVGPPTWDEEADPGDYDLAGFWVAPQARRREVARQLLTAAIEHAREQGAQAITLWVMEEGTAAQRLYESAGFELTGRVHELPEPRTGVERQMILRF